MHAFASFPLALILAAAWPHDARAHTVQSAGTLAGDPFAWNFEPWLLALLLVSAAGYALGVRRLWGNAGSGRGISVAQVASFALGWLTLVVALVSPVDALGNHLFSAHMVQHELLMVVAAPLLVVARPLGAWAWALSPAQRQVAGRWFRSRGWLSMWTVLTAPLGAWVLHAAALWAWHVPPLFDAALRNEALHIAQHASFFVTALFFWWAVLGHDARGRFGPLHGAGSLFTTMLHTTVLGVLLTIAPTPWYSEYLQRAPLLGMDPLEDQQLGGLIMWVPSGTVYVIAALALVGRMLRRQPA